MTSIAGKVGCTTETLRRWRREAASRRAGPAAQAVSERNRLRAWAGCAKLSTGLVGPWSRPGSRPTSSRTSL